jgi:hypothetical protein
MLRRVLRFFALLLVALTLATPGVQAQPSSATTEAEKSEHSAPALPYAVALLYTLAVLTIVCMPSRKT